MVSITGVDSTFQTVAFPYNVNLQNLGGSDYGVSLPTYLLGNRTYTASNLENVPFYLPPNGLNGWNGDLAANGGYSVETLIIPVNSDICVTNVYTLMNLYWGDPGVSLASITFVGSISNYSVNLFANVDFRDYNPNIFSNTLDSSVAVQATLYSSSWSLLRSDIQTFSLPDSFKSQSLVSIVIIDYGGYSIQRVVLEGLTVETCQLCPAPTPDYTIDPPSLSLSGSGFSTPNILTIEIVWPTVQTRSLPNVTFQNSDASIASGCEYTSYTVTPNGYCSQIITLNIPWTQATSSCGFYKSGELGSGQYSEDVWSGKFGLSAIEFVTTGLRDTLVSRDIEQQFVVEITFNKFATVSTVMNTYASVGVDSAITNEQFGTDIPGVGVIIFLSVVGYPYQLSLNDSGAPVDTTPPNIESSLTAVSSSPASQTGQDSDQYWKMTLIPVNGTCVLDGNYMTGLKRFQLVCTQAAIDNNDCPSPLVNPYVTFTFGITSSNFCGKLVADVGVVLKLQSYSDSKFLTPSTNFVLQNGGFAYFDVLLISSPQVQVSMLEITSITVSSNGLNGNVVLYNNGLTLSGTQFGLSFNNTGFYFELTSKFDIPLDSSEDVSVIVVVAIYYVGNSGQKRSTEFILSDPTQQTSSDVSGQISLSNAKDYATPGSASGRVMVSVATVLCFVFLLFGLTKF